MPKFEACNLMNTKTSSYNFNFRSAGETQLITEKGMEKFKLRLDAFVCGYMPKILEFSSSLVID